MTPLVERIEAASGPDRLLDAEIAVAIDWRWPDWEEGDRTVKGMAESHGIEWLADRMENSHASIWRNMPRFTASLDAAMSLVPEGWPSMAVGTTDDGRGYAQLAGDDGRMMAEDPDESYAEGEGATPALALCAAALRATLPARQSEEG